VELPAVAGNSLFPQRIPEISGDFCLYSSQPGLMKRYFIEELMLGSEIARLTH
jgi:hypothetical protein